MSVTHSAGTRRVAQMPIVLMFHGVVPRMPQYATFAGGRTCLLRSADFERAVRWCASRYQFLRLGELGDFITSGDTRPAVLLTFDDGLASMIDQAAPVLARYSASATVFVTTGWVSGQRTPHIFRLERDLWMDSPRQITVTSGRQQFTRTITSRREIGFAVTDLWSFLFASDTAPLALRPGQVMFDGRPWVTAHTDSRDFWFPASWAELKDGVARGLFDIGAHGVTHVPWTSLPTEILREEMNRSKAELEAQFGRAVDVCSYPHGMVDSRVAHEAANVFSWGFTNRLSAAEEAPTPMLLPRIHVPSERPFWMNGIVKHPLWSSRVRRLASVAGSN